MATTRGDRGLGLHRLAPGAGPGRARRRAAPAGAAQVEPRPPRRSRIRAGHRRRHRSPRRAPGDGRARTASSTSPAPPRCGREPPRRSSRSTSAAPGSSWRRRSRPGVERVVHTSSAGAVGPAKPGGTADETQPFTAGRLGVAYINSKHEAEVEALRVAAHGLDLVIVNPTFVLGPDDPDRGTSNRLIRRVLLRQIPLFVDGGLNVVDVRDVAEGHLLAERKGKTGRALHARRAQLHPAAPVRRRRPHLRRAAAAAEGPLRADDGLGRDGRLGGDLAAGAARTS